MLVIGPPAMKASVAASGHRFRPGGEPAEEQVAAIREQLPVLPRGEAAVLGNRELFGRLATEAMLPAMGQVFADWRPELVVREPCEYASAVFAMATETPAVQVAISLAQIESGALESARVALEEHRSGLTDALASMPYLTRFPRSLDPSPFSTTIRFHLPAHGPSDPLPDWWQGSRTPLIYVTFGTVLGHMSHAPGVFRAALRAVTELDARVLVTTGRRVDPATLGSVPSHVHVEPWVDQRRVMSEAAVVVCHGGSGTVFGALEAGVPLVTVPVFADQFENGRRVAAAGAGRHVVVPVSGLATAGRRPIGEENAHLITDAIRTVMADGTYRRRAGDIATEMAQATRVEDVLGSLAPIAGPAPG